MKTTAKMEALERSIDFESVGKRLLALTESGGFKRRKTVTDLLDKVKGVLIKARESGASCGADIVPARVRHSGERGDTAAVCARAGREQKTPQENRGQIRGRTGSRTEAIRRNESADRNADRQRPDRRKPRGECANRL